MKFVCERCQTKYSIADEKVRQKVLKIRCKTCENVITIRDAVVVTEPAAPRAEPPPAPAVAAAGAGARSVEWHLAVSGQQTGPFGLAALVTRILAAQQNDHNDEVYVWNEHLDGWKEPKQIPEVAAELRARAAAVDPPAPPVKRAPAGGHLGRPAPVSPRMGGDVGRGGRNSGAMAAVAQAPRDEEGVQEAAHEGLEEKTQISPLDASLLLDPNLAPTRQQPSLALLAKSAQAHGDKPGDKADKRDKHADKHDNKKAETKPAPAALSNGHVASGRKSGGLAAMASGLEGLDFSPPQVAASPAVAQPLPDLGAALPAPATAGKAVPVPVVGGNTSMLLSQVGARKSGPRHPAVKFVALGAVVLGLGGFIAFISLREPEKAPVAEKAPTPAADPNVDPEAQARAEAEKYFKSMIGEGKPAAAPVTKAVAPPAPRKTAGDRPARKAEPMAPPSLAPPPMGSTPNAPSTGGIGSRLAQEERRVAVPTTKDRGAKGNEEVDMQKVFAVVRQADHQQAMKSCYERALKRDATMKLGRLDITVTVGELGTAKRVSITAPPEFNQVKSCIQDSVKRWRFPPNSKEYEAAFPMIFSGSSG